jgi:hypothetical protein
MIPDGDLQADKGLRRAYCELAFEWPLGLPLSVVSGLESNPRLPRGARGGSRCTRKNMPPHGPEASCAPRPKAPPRIRNCPQNPAYQLPIADCCCSTARHCFCFAYIGPPNGPIQRPNPVRYVQCGCYETTARSEHQNWPVCDPRVAPPGEYGFKSGENGHLARANGAIDGPYCSPTWPCMFKRAGWSGWWVWGVELHQRPQAARGALLQFACLRKTRGAKGFGSCSRRLCAGWLSYVRFSRGGQEEKGRCFLQPTSLLKYQICKKKTIAVDVTKMWQSQDHRYCLRPPWRYRRSLVSKGRFTTSINVICVGIRSSLSKRRYRVVIDYVGDPLRHRGKAGCWLFRGL